MPNSSLAQQKAVQSTIIQHSTLNIPEPLKPNSQINDLSNMSNRLDSDLHLLRTHMDAKKALRSASWSPVQQRTSPTCMSSFPTRHEPHRRLPGSHRLLCQRFSERARYTDTNLITRPLMKEEKKLSSSENKHIPTTYRWKERSSDPPDFRVAYEDPTLPKGALGGWSRLHSGARPVFQSKGPYCASAR